MSSEAVHLPEASSGRYFRLAPVVSECLNLVIERKNCLGHGIIHVRKVAADAGAVTIIENNHLLKKPELERAVLLAHVAGVLHDPLAQFLSDALYDADKFRWSPDFIDRGLEIAMEFYNTMMRSDEKG